MSKYHISAQFVENEFSVQSVTGARFTIVYPDKSALNVTSGRGNQRIASGQVAIINTSNKQIQLIPERGFKGYIIQINDDTTAEVVERYLLIMNVPKTDVCRLTLEKHTKEIRAVFKNLVIEMRTEPEPSATIMNLLLQELLVRLYRTTASPQPGIHSNRVRIVSDICLLLDKEYNRAFTLESIANGYSISASYLSHIFKETTGIPLMRYLLIARVRAAQEYLLQTALPVNEIAEKCGFKDLSNFGRTFRKEVGCSPRQYRSSMHREGILISND